MGSFLFSDFLFEAFYFDIFVVVGFDDRYRVTCPLCGRIMQKSNLRQHMSVHTGERPFSCELCSYKASRSTTLRRHKMRVHNLNM